MIPFLRLPPLKAVPARPPVRAGIAVLGYEVALGLGQLAHDGALILLRFGWAMHRLAEHQFAHFDVELAGPTPEPAPEPPGHPDNPVFTTRA